MPLPPHAGTDQQHPCTHLPSGNMNAQPLLYCFCPCMQAYISSLHYNHTAANYFSVSKRRPYCLLMHTAKDMVKDALPIKCVEAVFLALLLTSSWHDLHRVPLGFKTRVGRRVYRYTLFGGRLLLTSSWHNLHWVLLGLRLQVHGKDTEFTACTCEQVRVWPRAAGSPPFSMTGRGQFLLQKTWVEGMLCRWSVCLLTSWAWAQNTLGCSSKRQDAALRVRAFHGGRVLLTSSRCDLYDELCKAPKASQPLQAAGCAG